MKITLDIQDNKVAFFLELLQEFDFIELKLPDISRKTFGENPKEKYDFFASAGLFQGRDIDANQLRQQAWQIKK